MKKKGKSAKEKQRSAAQKQHKRNGQRSGAARSSDEPAAAKPFNFGKLGKALQEKMRQKKEALSKVELNKVVKALKAARFQICLSAGAKNRI